MERLGFLSRFRKFCGAEDGAVGVILALSTPVVLGFAGLAVDYSMWKKEQTALTRVSESAAMAAAYARTRGVEDEAVLAEYAKADAARNGFDPATESLEINVDGNNITVAIQSEAKRYLSSVINSDPVIITARGHAELVAPKTEVDDSDIPNRYTYPCLLALERHPETNRGIYVHDNSTVNAEKCGLQSNSINRDSGDGRELGAIYIRDADVEADYIRSVGETVVNNFSGRTTTSVEPESGTAHFVDTFIVPQLFAFGPVSNFALCDHTGDTVVNLRSGLTTLTPGTYCGDIIVEDGGMVKFAPGVYKIHNGDLRVRDRGRILDSQDITIYFSGFDAGVWSIENASDVRLTAPSTGRTAGMLLWQNYLADCADSGDSSEQNMFTGRARLELEGIIYSPGCGVILDKDTELSAPADDAHLSLHAGWVEMKGNSKFNVFGAQADPYIADSTGYSKTQLIPDATAIVQNDRDFVPTLRFTE